MPSNKNINPAREKTENNILKSKKSISSTAKRTKNRNFPIVGLGGSAGAFDAFEKFFAHMPVDSGMAFVIIVHLDPKHKGRISGLLQKYTPMPVIEAEDGIDIEPDKVYVIPPDVDMGIHNGKLLLLQSSKPNGYHLSIDYFFQSLAEDQWNKAVGIIFSGMGSDGETGVRMIKEKLGMVMVQDPETANYNSMPLSAISTNLVDYVLEPEEMPVKLIQYINHPILHDNSNEQIISEAQNANAIQKILMLLRSHNGHDFSLYKKNTITRRIDRRIACHQLPDYEHYVNFLRENPLELDVLFNELLIGVTKFFRDAAAFEALTDKLHKQLSTKQDGEPIRVWVAACSTGEEAYSIAIILTEYLATVTTGKIPKIQIFATDLDSEAIEHARTGVYYENIIADVSEERLSRYFIKMNNSYAVKKELREMVVFAQHNLIKDAPFTKLDLLSCRNLMIYLTAELQKKVIPVFHYSLNPKGIFFMGPAETIGGFTDLFTPVDAKWKIFERKQGTSVVGKMLDFPFNISRQALLKTEAYSKPVKNKPLTESFNKLMLENFTPTSVLINEVGDILYINGKTGKFLELNSGEASMNIHILAKEEFKYMLSNAIHQVKSNKGTLIRQIKIKEEDQTRAVELHVMLIEEPSLQGLILIVFEDKGLYRKPSRTIKRSKELNDGAALEEMEKELLYTKQQLHSTIEQMETSVEELKSTNEELQSTNEELQSTNEEALTTKEEMQSLNEELMTINLQYQTKAEELTQLNNDMKNLLDSTEIGTIFLDNELNILRFTPQVKKLFNVIASDIGRSIMHVVQNFDYPTIEEDVKEVIETLVIKEIEIKTKMSDWYMVRIMPYRTLDNFISGAVLTFTKVTALKLSYIKMRSFQNYIETTFNELQKNVLLLDKDLYILTVNKRFLKVFELKEDAVKGAQFTDIIEKVWKTKALDTLLKECLNTASSVSAVLDPPAGSREFKISSKPFKDQETGETLSVMIVIE